MAAATEERHAAAGSVEIAGDLSFRPPRWRRLRELRALWREEGFRAAVARVAGSLVARVVAVETDVVVTKSLADAAHWSGRDRISLRPVEGAEDPLFQKFLRDAGIEVRLRRWCSGYAANGYHGFLALLGDKPIGVMWWVSDRIPTERSHPHLKRFGIELGQRDAYLFDFFVEPGHRGGGVANEFLAKIETTLERMGYQRLLGCVDISNKQARWLYGLYGWRDLTTHRCWTILSVFLLVGRRLFLRNAPDSQPHSFDFRQVYP